MNKIAYGVIAVLIIVIAVLLLKPSHSTLDDSAVNTGGNEEELISGNFIFKTNILLLLRTGQPEKVIGFLEESLEQELESINGFKQSNMRTVAFYNAGLLNENSKKKTFTKEKLIAEIGVAKIGIAAAQSTTCHPTTTCAGGFWCWRMPWSLRAVDTTATGIWRYIKKSGCGFTLRGNSCGQPVTGSVCF